MIITPAIAQERIAAGPARIDAFRAPNSHPDPMIDPTPVNRSAVRPTWRRSPLDSSSTLKRPASPVPAPFAVPSIVDPDSSSRRATERRLHLSGTRTRPPLHADAEAIAPSVAAEDDYAAVRSGSPRARWRSSTASPAASLALRLGTHSEKPSAPARA